MFKILQFRRINKFLEFLIWKIEIWFHKTENFGIFRSELSKLDIFDEI